MKILGMLFFLASLYYLMLFLLRAQVGHLVGFVILLCTSSIFYLLTDRKASEQIWFPSRRYGFGWGMPFAWQGFVIYGVFFLVIALTVIVIGGSTHSFSDALIGLVPTVGLLVGTLIAICYRYGEKPN